MDFIQQLLRDEYATAFSVENKQFQNELCGNTFTQNIWKNSLVLVDVVGSHHFSIFINNKK